MRKYQKSIIILLILIILANLILSPISYASSSGIPSDEEAFGISLGDILDTVFGFLAYPFKLVFVIPGVVANLILTEIASVGSDRAEVVTLESILFNDLALTDVNIFSATKTAKDKNVSDTIQTIRANIANWYYAFRNFAIVASLAVLIYIGIRMAIDNIAEQKAKYKQMLVNWMMGFGLIFVLHYFIIIVLKLNTQLVNAFNPGNITDGKNYMEALLEAALGVSLVQSYGSAIMYSILLVITFVFLMVYIKRMLMVCFLVMIAPLITIIYSIDKAGNNKSGILNEWLKEFCYNVLIQPFHCIIYIVFVGTAMKLMYESTGFNIGAMIFAIICILCLFIGEKMIRTIFGFTKSKSVAQKIFTGSMVTTAISNVQTIRKARQEEDEPEPPPIMPDGTRTEEAIAEEKTKKVTLKDGTSNIAPGQGSKDDTKARKSRAEKRSGASSQNSTKKSNKVMKTIQEKTPIVVKDMAHAYGNGIMDVTGMTALQRHEEKVQKRKMPRLEEQFLMASENYRRSVNPTMTNKQLALQMEAIMKTPMKDLKDGRDAVYKTWLEHVQKGLVASGDKDPIQSMKESIMYKDDVRNEIS